MHVLTIGPFAWSPKGTVSARAFMLARELVERGHQSTILIPPYDNPPHAGFEWTTDGVLVLNANLPSWGDSVRARLMVPLGMARHAANLRADVIHIFKPIGYSGIAGMYLRLLCPQLPLVLDCDDWEGRGGWAHTNPYPRLLRWFFSWQETWLARRSDAITVASRTLQTQTWGLGVRPECVFYLPNGPNPIYRSQRAVPVAKQNRLRRSLGVGNKPLALYIGHISYGAEVSLIIEALPSIIKTVPDFRVVIIGTGSGVRALQHQAERLGLEQHLVFVGWVDPSQTPAYLSIADLALYPHRDTLINRAKSPSKITAYMAMGLPIVATAVGETVEYLEGGRAGVLVPPGDAHAFANAIATLLKAPRKAAKLGARAEQRIWERYDWARLATIAEQAYSVAIAARH